MIQCAIEQKAELITLDKKLVEISKKMNIGTIEVN
jgi:predicted nucleic acid-binding protein